MMHKAERQTRSAIETEVSRYAGAVALSFERGSDTTTAAVLKHDGTVRRVNFAKANADGIVSTVGRVRRALRTLCPGVDGVDHPAPAVSAPTPNPRKKRKSRARAPSARAFAEMKAAIALLENVVGELRQRVACLEQGSASFDKVAEVA